jgi:hypothetical protein
VAGEGGGEGHRHENNYPLHRARPPTLLFDSRCSSLGKMPLTTLSTPVHSWAGAELPMRRLACWEVVATAVRRVARRAVRPRMANVMVELRISRWLGGVVALC